MAREIIPISHWSQNIAELQLGAQQFYTSVRAAVEGHGIPKLKLSMVAWKEGGIFSGKREYLRVERKGLLFDVCGAPFGKGFFVSWWMLEREGFLKGWLKNVFSPETFYSIDTANMFQSLVHGSVLQVLDEVMKSADVPALTENQRKPQHRSVFM